MAIKITPKDVKFGKEVVKEILEKTQEIIKSGKTEDKAKFLSKPKPTKIKVDTKEKDIIDYLYKKFYN